MAQSRDRDSLDAFAMNQRRAICRFPARTSSCPNQGLATWPRPRKSMRLIDTTRASLEAAIEQAAPGNRLGDIGAAVEGVAAAAGYEVVREYVGHGVGRDMHEEPQVPNYGPPQRGPLLRKGMVLALEPMVNVGDWRTKKHADG